MSSKFFIDLLPKGNRGKAREIIKALGEDFHVTNEGEIYLEGKVICGSNINELLLFTTNRRVSPKSNPSGLFEFMKFIKSKRVGLHLLSARAREALKRIKLEKNDDH